MTTTTKPRTKSERCVKCGHAIESDPHQPGYRHRSKTVGGHHVPRPADTTTTTTTQTEGERILAAITKALAVLKERFGLRPAEGFVYGYKDALHGADYQRVEYYPDHPEEPLVAYFEVVGVLAKNEVKGGRLGGTSFGLVPVNDATEPRIKGARLFVGWEADGGKPDFRVQFYNIPDRETLAEARKLLVKAFGSTATVQAFE